MRLLAIALTLIIGLFVNSAGAAELQGPEANTWASGLLGINLPNQITSLGPLHCGGEAPPANARWWHICGYGANNTPRYAGAFWRKAGVPGSDVYSWIYKKMGGATVKPLGCTPPAKFFVGGVEFDREDCKVDVEGLEFPVSFGHIELAGNSITLYVRDNARQATAVTADFAELLTGVRLVVGQRLATH
jgi:hypothetical protein